MSLHKLNREAAPHQPQPLAVALTLQHELYDLADTVLKTRAIRALEHAAAAYPIHRVARYAAKRKLEDVFDDLALEMGLTALRLEEGALLLDGPGVFIHAEGRRKAAYCSCVFAIWTQTKERAVGIREQLQRLIGEHYASEQMFTVDWHFVNARHGLSSTSFEELASDTLHDEAYPTLGKPVQQFIADYLASSATVLILQGPPGAGKTRLVRAILGEMSRRRPEGAKVMYTADRKALEGDEIFVDFITGSHDAFVIEDADHLLLARSNGNHDLHRFLAVADGVVRAQGRKIIFTTNLPNMSDIDEALLRPGRCFASVAMRALTVNECAALLHRLTQGARESALGSLFAGGTKTASLASVYKAAGLLRC